MGDRVQGVANERVAGFRAENGAVAKITIISVRSLLEILRDAYAVRVKRAVVRVVGDSLLASTAKLNRSNQPNRDNNERYEDENERHARFILIIGIAPA